MANEELLKIDKENQLFINKFNEMGNEGFYKFLLGWASNKLMRGDFQSPTPEQELMSYHDKFLVLYKQDSKEIFIELAKICRRAANKIYRMMLEAGVIDKNDKFLNLVK